jgi:hypothetical protein
LEVVPLVLVGFDATDDLRADFAFGLQRMHDCLQERTGEGNDF